MDTGAAVTGGAVTVATGGVGTAFEEVGTLLGALPVGTIAGAFVETLEVVGLPTDVGKIVRTKTGANVGLEPLAWEGVAAFGVAAESDGATLGSDGTGRLVIVGREGSFKDGALVEAAGLSVKGGNDEIEGEPI